MKLKSLVVIAFNVLILLCGPIAVICEFASFLPSAMLEKSGGIVGPNPFVYIAIVFFEAVMVGFCPTVLLFPFNDTDSLFSSSVERTTQEDNRAPRKR
ncbi:MAG: hypothetical protein ABSG57_08150 [Candidatus Bathyarchaeia archaeon]